MATLGNPKNTIEIIQKYQFAFQKKFGQNFLIDTRVLDKIISAAGITEDDCVLEIGPGIGTMTQYLAEHAGKVVAVEIDTNLLPILDETLKGYPNVTVINSDILKLDMNKLVDEYNDGRPIKVAANLPYYITTPIIMGLFESNVPIDNITVMVQKEVADRMQVGPAPRTTAPCPWQCSTMQSLILWQMCRPTALFPAPMWVPLSSASQDIRSRRCRWTSQVSCSVL